MKPGGCKADRFNVISLGPNSSCMAKLQTHADSKQKGTVLGLKRGSFCCEVSLLPHAAPAIGR